MCMGSSPSMAPVEPPKVTPPTKSPENAGEMANSGDVARRRGLMGAAQNVATSGMGLSGSKANTANPNMAAFTALTGNSYLG